MIIVNALLAVMWFVVGAVAFRSPLGSTCAGIIAASSAVMMVSRFKEYRRQRRIERARACILRTFAANVQELSPMQRRTYEDAVRLLLRRGR